MGGHATLPGAPGGDVAGTVEALGEGVTDLRVGDRVVVDVDHSAYADHVVADAGWAITIPDTMDAAEATLLPSPWTTGDSGPLTAADPTPQRPETRIKPVIAACLLAVFLAMLDSQIVPPRCRASSVISAASTSSPG
ncbi:alcohol dehydrogenase catalytic domain-containing protein [Streptomyces sp. NPDC058818]|uniref:alcohol dehydrogenase catalytic domain-containing protein n=1 Tax=Streptomyces sp. NPDC058818 TaxID=3346640 RepID=UPI0036A234D9